ncbi:unnamed protein product [Rotaria sordida]|uniref:Ty3 transposon capsid-like protein domain-containing protein n=1 Tax=Rotaria sordida TaxID=392033 RepID=A0A814NX74_9BILA|nr:unnamed protein product [Rotaria sordida]
MDKSASLDSLNLQTISTTSVLTSTANPDVKPSSFSKLTRRMAIIPTLNRPVRLLTSAKIQSCINEDTSMMNINIDTDKHLDSGDKNHFLLGNKQNSSELFDIVDNRSNQVHQNKDEENEDNLFDTFICSNFVHFSGTQAIDQWLDETEALFNRFRISRRLRFIAIPLLVQSEAKRKYIRNCRSITSFDDFYEFLLTNFDTIPSISSTSKPSYVHHIPESTKNAISINKSIAEFKSNAASSTDSSQISQSCVSRSNNTIGNDTTNVNGDVSDLKSTLKNSSNDTSPLDSVIPDLRKAIVSDFIKNPKIFLGTKDDVMKLVDEIDHLMQIAHVPDFHRLDLILYSLRGDALQWFKNNKSALITCGIFVQEIKKVFTSSFFEELAFKALESYTQDENQSIRNFYNEVLKLCNAADSSMSESTKLKNLLNKVKPSIQLEVRKRKPKLTAEFLEFAKEVEELLQLSNLQIDTSTHRSSNPVNSNIHTSSSSFFPSTRYNNSDYHYTPSLRRNFGNNAVSTSFTYHPSRSSKSDKTQSYNSYQYSHSNRFNPSTNNKSSNNNNRK